MAHGPETGHAPGGKKLVGLGPAVKADAEVIPTQDSERFDKGRLEPAVIDVVLDRATVTGAVVNQVRRIGQDEVHAPGGHAAHQFDTIAFGHGIDHLLCWNLDELVRVPGFSPFLPRFLGAHPAKPARCAAPKARAAFSGRGPELVSREESEKAEAPSPQGAAN